MKVPSKPPGPRPIPTESDRIQDSSTSGAQEAGGSSDAMATPSETQSSQSGPARGHELPQPASGAAEHAAAASGAIPDAPPSLATDSLVMAAAPLVTPADIADGSWKLGRYTLTLDAVAADCLAKPMVKEALKGLVKPQQAKTDQHLQTVICDTLAQLMGEPFHGAIPKEDSRERYKSFLSSLRDSIGKAHKPKGNQKLRQDARVVTLAIARSLFTGVTESSFQHDLVQATKTHGDPTQNFVGLASSQGAQIAARLEQSQALIMGQKATLEGASSSAEHLFNMATGIIGGELGSNYDPYLQGNTPYRLFELETTNRRSTCIRMGTTTMQLTPIHPHITPEFVEFLQGQGPKEHHLYINRQKRTGVEGERTRVLEAFQDRPDIQTKLTLVTLAADGDLYNQSDEFAPDCDFGTLKARLISELMQNNEGFFFSEGLKERLGGENGFATFLDHGLEQAQRELGLPNGASLSQNKRRAIVFHFLNKTLVENLVDIVEATTYNNTCKDDIDRGGMANAYLYAMMYRPAADASAAELEKFAQNLEAIAFAPAMIVKKRGVVPHRFHDLTNALKQLKLWN